MLNFLSAAIVCFLPAFADPDLQPAVQRTLDGMSKAAVAGDTEGFLKLVDTSDREFLNEQKYFAKDLARKPAAAVSATVGEVKLEGAEARGPVVWTWTMPGEGKKERTVKFDGRFVEYGGDWLYAGEVWDTHEAPGVIVYHPGGMDELASRTVRAFEAVRERVEEGFGLTGAELPNRTQKIKLYGSMRHLQQSICLAYEDGLSGWNEPGESIKLLAGRNSEVEGLKSLLAHEYGHVATFELGPKSNEMPWWILEGVAELSAEFAANGRGADRTVARWAKQGKLVAWEDLADFHTVKPKDQGHVYSQGHHMVAYISGRWGRVKRNDWMRAMGAGKTLDQATTDVLDMPFAQLNDEWRASLPAEEAKEPEKVKGEGE